MAKKILLIDDDEAHAILSRLLLERLQYEVQVCLDAAEAECVFRTDPESFYFVATDYSMEPLNGLDLARRLLLIHPAVAILLLTGNDHPALIREARAVGVRAVSLKPISTNEFLDVIQSMKL